MMPRWMLFVWWWKGMFLPFLTNSDREHTESGTVGKRGWRGREEIRVPDFYTVSFNATIAPYLSFSGGTLSNDFKQFTCIDSSTEQVINATHIRMAEDNYDNFTNLPCCNRNLNKTKRSVIARQKNFSASTICKITEVHDQDTKRSLTWKKKKTTVHMFCTNTH